MILKKRIAVSAFLSLVILLGSSLNTFAAKQDKFKKEFDKTYPIDEGANLKINSSFSEVVLENWTKNEIQIHMEFIVEAKDQEKAEKIFNEFTAELTGSSKEVSIKTEFENKNNMCKEWDIIVSVKAPAHISLEADVSFGSLEIDRIEGTAKIDQQFGNLDADYIGGRNSEIYVAYGSGELDYIGGGEIDCDFGDLDIDKLNGDAEISVSYGEINIDEVSSNCKNLEINCEFGDINLDLDDSAAFEFTANASMGDISLPSRANYNDKSSDWGGSKKSGTIGTGAMGKLKINCSFGDVSID